MIATNDLKEQASTLGATFFGVADLAPARDEIHGQGGDIISQFPRSISIGIALPGSVVDRIGDQQNRIALMSYQHHGYDVINRRLDAIVSRLASSIQQVGHEALPIAASQTIDREKHLGAFSHKLGAHLAGLGWIGKSCLLVTPQVGPWVRWASVLTDAPIEATGSSMEERCGSCTQCVDICPVGAFSGMPFRENEPRSVRMDAQKCRRHQEDLGKRSGFNLCGLCLHICPYGAKSSRQSVGGAD